MFPSWKGYKFALSLIIRGNVERGEWKMAQMIPGEEGGKICGKTGEKIEDREKERERGRERERSSLREVIHAATRSRFSFTQRIMHLELTISKG